MLLFLFDISNHIIIYKLQLCFNNAQNDDLVYRSL